LRLKPGPFRKSNKPPYDTYIFPIEPCIFFSRTSLFKGCSALYCLLLVVTCVSFLTSEVVTNSVPLHYFEVTTSNPNH
jgi:hypothetical protein